MPKIIDIDEANKLLIEFATIPQKEYRRTFMEIAGYPHYENVCSNILAFFLNPQNEHKLTNLVLRSLLECIHSLHFDDDFDNITISREYPTDNKGRIDLFIETNTMVIAIENKIFHPPYNDFNDYWLTTQKAAQGRMPVCIVLALDKLNMEEPHFVSITYADFIKRIQHNLGYYSLAADIEYKIMLTGFLNTILRLRGTIMDKKLFDFYLNNIGTITKFQEGYNQALQELKKKLETIKEILEPELPKNINIESWWYGGEVLVYDFDYPGQRLGIDIKITLLHGWDVTFFGRKARRGAICPVSAINANIKELTKSYKTTKDGYRYIIIADCPVMTSETEVVKSIQSILKNISNLATVSQESKVQ